MKKKLDVHVILYQQGCSCVFDVVFFLSRSSLEVFKALGFDPHTMQSALPGGGAPPPQDAVACLDRLSSMLSQLLQAFSRYLCTPFSHRRSSQPPPGASVGRQSV